MRPSFTPTMTPQPVPQKRQGALDHVSFASAPVGRMPAVAEFIVAGRLTPAAAAAVAAACTFK